MIVMLSPRRQISATRRPMRPRPDQSKRLAHHLGADERGLARAKLTGGQVVVAMLEALGQGQQHGDGVFGRGLGRPVGRVGDDDAALGGVGQVHIVDADAGARDHGQIGQTIHGCAIVFHTRRGDDHLRGGRVVQR